MPTHERCGHGMLAGKCVSSTCKHFDGGPKLKKRVFIPKAFLHCTGCQGTVRREKMIVIGKSSYCEDCARCECGELRRSGSHFCQACFDRYSRPKKCEGCGDQLICAGEHDRDLHKHTRRSRCVPCSRRFAMDNWYLRKTAVSA